MTTTYSHSLDDSSDRSELPVDGLNIHANKASSSFDQRHLVEISYIYRLPLQATWHGIRDWLNRPGFGSEDVLEDPDHPGVSPAAPAAQLIVKSGSGRIAHVILDHWDFSGLTLVQSGSRFGVYNAGGTGGISAVDNAGVANGLSPLYESYPDHSSGLSRPLPNSGSDPNRF